MKFMDQISSVKGFQQQWCGTGSKKLQHTAALEHAESMSQKKTFDLCLKGLGLNIQKRTKKEQLLLSSTGQQSIIHCINVMNGKDFRQTKKKFQIAYFLAEKEAPLSSFRKLISHKERQCCCWYSLSQQNFGDFVSGIYSRKPEKGIGGKVNCKELL